jgi:hypothetical protein
VFLQAGIAFTASDLADLGMRQHFSSTFACLDEEKKGEEKK